MSELKAYIAPTPDGTGLADYYLKSEADKAIAELQKQVHDYEQSLYVIQARADKDARHQKYKRCLAMAKLCRSEWAAAIFIPEKGGTDKQAALYMKWEKRWRALANKYKYKEAK